ncbi:chromatin modification-related protein MEAF6-like, partial [Pistacia vera]|uniref:chromatin modification-related protein MEAF6-like n=1 Tax=Pistacia vera TaxID=55513 RepID=UPI0012630366
MDPDGQRTPASASAVMASLLSKRAKLLEELRNIERQVYDMETSYLQDPSQCGNVLKGFEGFLSSSKNTALYGVAIIYFLFHFFYLKRIN